MTKFIHHECISARHADEQGGAGNWDIIEDDGPALLDQFSGMIISRHATVADAISKAQELADAFDDKKEAEFADTVTAPIFSQPQTEAQRLANAVSVGIAFVDVLTNALRVSGAFPTLPPQAKLALTALEDWAVKAGEELPVEIDG